ncbi:ABC transporter ATP-binding protein [Jeotgalicoccus aerolatus]|nr:ABC transporter ATP-binding protein [Jeotgalicoccus aerolatus]
MLMFFIIILGSLCLTLWGLSSANALTALADYNIKGFFKWILIMGVIFLFWVAQIYLETWQFSATVQQMNIEMRKDISKNVSDLDYETFFKNESGTYVSWMINDVGTINEYGYANLSMVTSQVFNIMFSSIALLSFHYTLNISVILLAVIMLIVPNLFKRRLNNQMLSVTSVNEKMTTKLTDLMNGFSTILSLNLKDYIINNTVRESQKVAKEKVAYAKYSGVMSATTNGVSLISQVLIISLAGYLFFKNIVPIGTLTAAQYFSATIFSSLTGLSANLVEFKTTSPIFEKFNVKNKLSKNTNSSYQFKRCIEMKNIQFAYDDVPILKDFSLTVHKGGKYAIIGESGSGKSSILNLLIGYLTEYQGSIQMDGIDYDDIKPEALRDNFTYISQQPHIFSGSVKENITLGVEYSQEEINQVLEFTGLTNWIKSLPAQEDTYISYNSQNISGGQKQRIALARGIIRGREIILLDEATSAIDKSSSVEIERRLVRSNYTVVMITHRLNDVISKELDYIYQIK